MSRGIATADVDGDGRLDFAVANQWAASSFYRNQAPRSGRVPGLHLLLPVDPDGAGPTRSRPGHPGARLDGPARHRGGGDCRAARRPATASPRSTAATATPASGAPTSISASGRAPPTTPLQVELRWRDPAGRVRRETLRSDARAGTRSCSGWTDATGGLSR